jgi:hypothetical protein
MQATRYIDDNSFDSLLVTNLTIADLAPLAAKLPLDRSVFGYHRDTGWWVLSGTATRFTPGQWRDRRSVPLGLPALPN